MSETEVGTAELRQSANEIDWRHVWLTNVMIDTGTLGPPKIARRKLRTGKSSFTRRLHKLRRMRAALEPPKAAGRC